MKLGPPQVTIKFDSPNPAQATVFGASYLIAPDVNHPLIDGAYEIALSQGDPIDSPSFPRFDPNPQLKWFDPNNGADRIRLWKRYPGKKLFEPVSNPWWPAQGTNVVISNHSPELFHWMTSLQGPKEGAAINRLWVSAVESPSIYIQDGRYHCWFTAIIADPTNSTRRNGVLRHAVSDDLLRWYPVRHGTLPDFTTNDPIPVMALVDAALYFGPFDPDSTLPEFGTRGVCSVPIRDGRQRWTYLFLKLWTDHGSKNLLARVDPDVDNCPLEMWHDGTKWERVEGLLLPEWYWTDMPTGNVLPNGNPYPLIIDHVVVTPPEQQQFGLLHLISAPDGKALYESFSDGPNPASWNPPERIEQAVQLASARYPRIRPAFDSPHGRIAYSTDDASIVSEGGKLGEQVNPQADRGLQIVECDVIV